jgi:hypothetical protein
MSRTPRNPTRASVPTEHAEAVALMRLVHLHEPQHPVLTRFFHCPNGGLRSKAAAGKLKAEGVRPGVPDFLLPASGYAKERGMYDRYVGLAIELKRRKGGAVSAAQRDWIEYLSDAGWRVVVADGHERAWACICEYIGIRNCLEGGA